MQALRVHDFDAGPRPDELPSPEPGPGEVRVRVQACGVCHTDIGFWKARMARSFSAAISRRARSSRASCSCRAFFRERRLTGRSSLNPMCSKYLKLRFLCPHVKNR